MRIHISKNNILDFLFIVTYSIGYVSLFKYITYAIFPIPESIALFVFLVSIYILRFSRNSTSRKIIKGNLFIYLVLLYLWEILQGLMVGADINGIVVVLFNLASTYIAYKYLSNIAQTKLGIEYVINTYSVYMYYTVFVVVISAILILGNVLSPYSNVFTSNSLMKTNMETMGGAYYFPGYLSVVYLTPSIFLSIFNFPSLSGLSHESQAMFFTIYPALFLQFAKGINNQSEKKIIIIFLLTTIITTSLTAIICFLLAYTFHLFWKFRNSGQRTSAILILTFIVLTLIYIISSHFNEIFMTFFLEKANFDSAGSSGSYSLNLLTYVVSPSGLIGQGIFSSTAEQAIETSINCGYISSVMLIGFYILFLFSCVKNIFTENILCHSIGLASLYFVTHSLKYGIQVFNNNYIFFIVFLLTCANLVRNKGSI